MSSNAWNTVSDIANVSGIAQNAVSSALLFAAGYAVARSPQSTALQECREKLHQTKEALGAVPAERRHRIEAAAARGDCRSFASLEVQHQYLWDEHTRLSRENVNASVITRSYPWTKLRKDISYLQVQVAQLLNDTWATTQAHDGGRQSAPPPRNRSISMNTLPAGSGTISPAHVGSNGSAPLQSDRTIDIPMDTLPARSGTTTQAHVGGNGSAPPSPLEVDVALASISTVLGLYSDSGTVSSMV